MGWRDLLEHPHDSMVLPWLGGRSLRSASQTWTLDGHFPTEHGWYKFTTHGRLARVVARVVPHLNLLSGLTTGYLVGDHVVAEPSGKRERVWLLEDTLDRFERVQAGRVHEGGPLVFHSLAMPLGPEDEVLQAYLDRFPVVDHIKGVTPALNDAFRLEVQHREEAERRRAELERRRIAEEQRRAQEAKREELLKTLGDGAGRRRMAAVDFAAAASVALAVGGAELLDERKRGAHERVVRYRLDGQRFECVCDARTMQIVDAGICLTDHDTEEKGDTYFTLESLPAVVRQAINEQKLVVYRHV